MSEGIGELLSVQVDRDDRRWLSLYATRSERHTSVELIEPQRCLQKHNGHANRDVFVSLKNGRIMGWA